MPYNLRSRERSREVHLTTLPSRTVRKTRKSPSKTLSSNEDEKEIESADGYQTIVEKNIKSSNGGGNSGALGANRTKKGQEDSTTSKKDERPSAIDGEISKQKDEFHVRNWNLKVVKGGYMIVEGITSDSNKRWHSGCIRRAIPPTTLISKSGSVYRLIGEPDKRLLDSLTKQDFFQWFTNGLPNNWESYIIGLKHLSSGVRTRSTSTPIPSAVQPPPTSTPMPSAVQPPPTLTPMPSAVQPPPTLTLIPSAIQPPPTSTLLPRITETNVQPPPTPTPLPSGSRITVSSPIVSPLKGMPSKRSSFSQQRTPPPLSQIKMSTPSIHLTKSSDHFVSSLKRSSSGRLLKPVLLNTTNGRCNYTYSITGELLWINGQQPSESAAHTPLAVDSRKKEPTAKQKKTVQKKKKKVPFSSVKDSEEEEDHQLEDVGDSEGDQHQTGTTGDTEEEEEEGQEQAEFLGLTYSKSSSKALSKDTIEQPSMVNVSSTNAGKRKSRRKRKSLVYRPKSKRKVANRETSGNKATDQHFEDTTESQQHSEDTTGSQQHSVDTTGSQQQLNDTIESQQHLDDTIQSQKYSKNSPKWNQNIMTKLKRVVYSIPAMHEDFWEEVSRIMGADEYSPEECRKRYNGLKRESTKDKNTINKGVNGGLQRKSIVGSRDSVTPQRDIFLSTQAPSFRNKRQTMFRSPSENHCVENEVYRSDYTVPVPKRCKTSRSTPNTRKRSFKEPTKIRDSRTGEERMFTLFSDEEEDDGSTSDEDRYYSILDLLSRSPLTGYRK